MIRPCPSVKMQNRNRRFAPTSRKKHAAKKKRHLLFEIQEGLRKEKTNDYRISYSVVV
jgi:hypothetical protein